MSSLNELDMEDTTRLYDFTIRGTKDFFDLNWPNLNIQAKVSRFNGGTGSKPLTAEVWISSQRPNGGHIVSGTLNLLSTQAKGTFERACVKRDDGVDWNTMIEQMCTAAVERHRLGRPVVELTGDVLRGVTEDEPWMVHPIIQQGMPTLMYGSGSSGKSYLAIYIAVLLQEGINRGGLTGINRPHNVLYLDWETDQNEIMRRIARVRRGLGLDPYNSQRIFYRYMTQGLANDQTAIMDWIRNLDISFIVLDSLGSACAGEPESADVVNGMFDALREFETTSLCIDHKNKDGGLFGSVYKFNRARLVFEMKKSQDPGDTYLDVMMRHQKANNSPLIKQIGWSLTFNNSPDEYAVDIERKDLIDTGLADEMHVADRIAYVLKEADDMLTSKQIADLVDKSPGGISTALSKDKSKAERFQRFIHDTDNNKWGLKPPQPHSPDNSVGEGEEWIGL